MAIVLLPPIFLPNNTNNCKSDWVGIANLTKHCLAISPKESKSVVQEEGVLVEADRRLGREKQLGEHFRPANPDCQPIHELLRHAFHAVHECCLSPC